MNTKQQPPLPTLQPGDSHMESLIEAAIQGHASTRDAMRWLVRQLVPHPSMATQAELTDAQILSLDCVSIDSDEHGTSFWVDRSTVIKFARAILALRPERVPMAKDAVERAAMYWAPEYRAALKAGIASAEAHHGITAQAKKETP